ncbi:MAG: Clp protease N-terminal domain-containing protein [Terracidiphilus sp.]|jgi:ATP-dependent Clp protease ATP-binding subunit ClpC
MFERYTEKARRVIFFARYEASQFGSPVIEPEHLLLGLLREDKALTNRFLRSHASVEAIRKKIGEQISVREKVSTSVDLPLSSESKRVLAYAAEEAERLGHKHIGTEHLLLGILREEKCFAAALLLERGLKLEVVREELKGMPHETGAGTPPEPAQPDEPSRDLTQAAREGELGPVVGRDREIDALIEILSRRDQKNPILVGERGVGKTAIVEALAQRIADGTVPQFLAEKRILVFDPQSTTARTTVLHRPEAGTSPLPEILRKVMQGRTSPTVEAAEDRSEAILFVRDLKEFRAESYAFGSAGAAKALSPAITRGKTQCIATSTPSEYQACLEAVPWLADCFRSVYVRPLDEESTLRVLQARKQQYEEFHEVTYSDEALECAARSSSRFLPESQLPGTALELLDMAGARMKLRQTALPEEVTEVKKRIRFIVHRTRNAIQNHEFEKARFYSDEERKERESLRALREKYHLNDSASSAVGREDVEEVISRWAEYPFRP